MIQLGEIIIDLNDPTTQLIGAGLLAGLVVLVLLIMSVRRSGQSVRTVETMVSQLGRINIDVQTLGQGQAQLQGNISSVTETQAAAQALVIQTMETRLADVQQQMTDRLADNAMRSNRAMTEMQEHMKESLHGSSEKTTKSLTELQERLATIDKAQTNIEKLSGDVLSLQDILSDKQARGAFGEIQLKDIVSKALPADSYSWQQTLSNGKRVDCLIDLPNPPGPIAIDAKFPLEDYKTLIEATTEDSKKRAHMALKNAVRKHIADISEKYIIEGETADGALMFLPSEAIYAELHAHMSDVVHAGFAARVWIVSPTTCMATLNTMRAILKDARMREQAGAIRKALGQLHRDVELVVERTAKLETHFDQARRDVEGISTAAERAGKRAARLDNFDFEELETDAAPVVRLAPK